MDKDVRRKGRKGRAIVRLDLADVSVMDKEGYVLYENHYKAKYVFGLLVYKKRYRANSKKVDARERTGFKNSKL